MRAIDTMDRFYSRLSGEIGEAVDKHLLANGWQINATIEAVRPICPTVAWVDAKNPNKRARIVGALIGHSVAHHRALCAPRIWGTVCKGMNAVIDLFPLLEGEKPIEERFSEDENPFIESSRSLDLAVSRSMRFVVSQPPLVQIQFFEAYTKALRKGSVTIDGSGVAESTRTSAYQLIAAFGPLLRLRCSSVHDVHRFLVAMLGSQRAGTIKRTEAVCKSLNMRLRSSGRPVKAALNTPEAS